MQIIEIDALDTLCFRDGKPFTSGEDTWATTTFPPSPSVIYGALRGTYFSNHIAELEHANQRGKDPTEQLRIRLIMLQTGRHRYFPLPLDCIVPKKSKEQREKKEKDKNDSEKAIVLKKVATSAISNCPVNNILRSPDRVIADKEQARIVTHDELTTYLEGSTTEIRCKKISEFIVPEPKLGIGRVNETHATQEGRLYRIDMRRLEPKMKFNVESTRHLSLVVGFDDLTLPDAGIMRLGGEGKAGKYTLSETMTIDSPTITGKRFKLYLMTPAIFGQGWLPCWLDAKTFEGTYHNLRLRLETAMLGKSFGVGGFDMARKRPKKMRRVVPAGSVYYFEIVQGTIDEAITVFHNQSIADGEKNRKQGFGLTLIGGAA
ncbi:CRISPR-associated protein, Cmr3 family [Candidatus Vecturithrix granuli]|uniref:CRISPR-associated protein, Cmr3 family n=1 Tax=Vecturithrix granuli TaxID=1499967 RepID=A0A081CAK6_VECG1|nr:CRISPR-associated protein, Cmr3 family [Candidatus Vecturithrix granuli]